MNCDSRRLSCRFHFRKRSFDRTSDLQRVRAVLAGDNKYCTRGSLNGGRADHGFGTFGNRGDVFQSHAAAVLVPQDNVPELLWRKLLPFGSEYHTLVWSIHETGSANTGCSSGRIEHIIDRRAELEQTVRTDLDLKLPDLAAEDHDLSDAGHGQKARPQRPICKGPDLHQ